jgi:hypothetical protein
VAIQPPVCRFCLNADLYFDKLNIHLIGFAFLLLARQKQTSLPLRSLAASVATSLRYVRNDGCIICALVHSSTCPLVYLFSNAENNPPCMLQAVFLNLLRFYQPLVLIFFLSF